MSHETHHHHPVDRPSTSFTSAIWFVIILVGLFIAAVNFVNVMGSDEKGHGSTESAHPQREQSASGTLEGETGTGKPAEQSTQHFGTQTAGDTTHVEGH